MKNFMFISSLVGKLSPKDYVGFTFFVGSPSSRKNCLRDYPYTVQEVGVRAEQEEFVTTHK